MKNLNEKFPQLQFSFPVLFSIDRVTYVGKRMIVYIMESKGQKTAT